MARRLLRGPSTAQEATILNLTENAAAAIRRLIVETRDRDILGVRISVRGGGCAGVCYDMGLETTAGEGDAVIQFDDVRVFVDAGSQLLLAGAEVDFSDSPIAGFVFNNPNACGRIGCEGNPGAGAQC
jgi:iron-sulfur cluster assembly protein